MWRRSSGRGRPATCRPSTPAGSSEFACASVRPVTTLPVMLRSTSVAFLPMVVGPVGGAVMVTGTVGGTQHDRDDLVPALLHPVGVPAEQPQQVLAIFDRPILQHRGDRVSAAPLLLADPLRAEFGGNQDRCAAIGRVR